MRLDLEALKKYINWDKTLAQFSQPKDNRSRIIIECANCAIPIEISILQLKNRLKRQPRLFCNSCGSKQAWTEEHKSKYQDLWNNPEYREKQSAIRRKMWEDPHYREKHAEGCAKSYSDSNRRTVLSKGSAKLWQNPDYRKRQINAKRKLWEDPEYKKKQEEFKTKEYREARSAEMKQIWQNPEYRENQSERQTLVWQKPGYKEEQSERQKIVWREPGYREEQSERQKIIWQNPEYRKFFDNLWQNKEYKAKLSAIIKAKWENPEFREKASAASKRRWDNPDYRNRVTTGLRRQWQNPEYKRRQIAQGRALWKDPVFLEKMGKARAAQANRKSSIEIITEFILNSMQIKYEFQSPVGPFLFDFFLLNYGVYLEVQGEYWHSFPDRHHRDAAKFTYLEKAYPDAKILYLYEHEFLNPKLIASKISNFVVGHEPEIEQNKFKLSSVEIAQVDIGNAREFLNSFHYGAFGRSSKVIHGAFLKGELIAICKMSTVVRKEVATSVGLSHKEVLELDRFCIHPAYQKKNFASWFLSRAVKLIFGEFNNILCLVSFADLTYGHLGIIYKAAGWLEIGRIRPDYYYIGPDGYILHKKTLYNRAQKMGMKEREYAEKRGYIKSFGKEKIKYLFRRR